MRESDHRKEKIAVSIIVPVYNVSKWLKQCVESVVNQTFANFELLLIDDGSTDDSGEKCDSWAEMDNRIKVVHKTNEGVPAARNDGIRMAEGEYLAFLDSDDWLDITFLEKMYGRAKETDADFVECDIWRYHNISKTKTYAVCYGSLGIDYSREEHMIYGNTAIWKLLTRRSLWTENKITFSDCHSEATPVYALLIAKANRIENVREALYYYRRFREGSLTMKPKLEKEHEAVGIRAFEYLLKNFRERGLDGRYEKNLERMIKYKMTDLMAAFFYRMNKEDYKPLSKYYYEFIVKNFPGKKEIRYLTWGGYNLTRVLWKAKYLHDPYGRFNFSSFVSLMNPPEEKIDFSHKVRYREMMLEREIQNDFWEIMREMKSDYIIMNFLEERFDVLEYGGGYLTKSDALDGAKIELSGARIIKRDSEECRTLWERSALKFIQRLKEEYPKVKIVLVKDYLTETKGNLEQTRCFENIDEIRTINKILRQYYTYFEKN